MEEKKPETTEEQPTATTSDKEEALTQECERLKKEMLYLRAEFDNSRKRMAREQEQAIKFANERLVRELHPIIDMLDRAIQHGKTSDAHTLISGVELTQKELNQLLERFGVEFVGATGEAFDPNKHEAVSHIESEVSPPGSVVEVLQRGCLLNGRLLVPARVTVARAKS